MDASSRPQWIDIYTVGMWPSRPSRPGALRLWRALAQQWSHIAPALSKMNVSKGEQDSHAAEMDLDRFVSRPRGDGKALDFMPLLRFNPNLKHAEGDGGVAAA